MNQRISADPDGHGLESVIRECHVRLDEIESANRLTRWLLAGASLGLLLMAGAFGWSLWRTLERRMTSPALEKAIQTKIEAIGPPLGEKLAAQVMSAVPAYRDLALERGMRVMPALSAGIAKEVESFATDTEKAVKSRSDAAMRRVATKLADDLKRQFPTMTEARVDHLAQRLRDGLMSEGAGVAEELQRTMDHERVRLAALLEKLPVDAAMQQSESSLQKRFIHNMLMMIDAAVEEWPVDDETAAGAPATGALLPLDGRVVRLPSPPAVRDAAGLPSVAIGATR
jgi:hypothetical protein